MTKQQEDLLLAIADHLSMQSSGTPGSASWGASVAVGRAAQNIRNGRWTGVGQDPAWIGICEQYRDDREHEEKRRLEHLARIAGET